MKMLREYLEDVGQAFFLRDAYFGASLLLLFLGFDPACFACGLFASVVGYAATVLYSTPKVLRDSGLVTLNGFFFGIAMASLFKWSPHVALFLLAGSLAVPLVTQAAFEVMQHWKLSAYVIPYILCAWVLWLCAGAIGLGMRRELWPEIISTLPARSPDWALGHLVLDSAAMSVGRLLFVPSSQFGIAVVTLLTIFSPRKGAYLFIGSLLGSGLAFVMSAGHAWEYGYYSFCAGLVGLGLASRPERIAARTILMFCALSCFLTLAADHFLRTLHLPVLSLPYVLTLWTAVLSRTPRVNLSWARARGAA